MRTIHAVAVLAAGLAVAGTATGITYAATTGTGSVHACANAKGTLRLLDSHGHCPSHYSKVSISERGPRGPRGARGPGAHLLSVHTTSSTATASRTYTDAATGLQIEALCSVNSQSSIYVSDQLQTTEYAVSGQSYFTAAPAGTAYVVYQGSSYPVTDGADQLDFIQPGDANSLSEVVDTGGVLTAEVLVTRGTASFTVSLVERQSTSRCSVQAQITPAG